jgi:hypothetical protein
MQTLWQRLTEVASPMTEDGVFRGVHEDDVRFNKAMESEDDLGRTLRAHLHIEALLTALLLRNTKNAGWLLHKMTYSRKVNAAREMRLIPGWMKNALDVIGALRNNFAHQLDYKLTDEDVALLYGKLKTSLKATIDSGVKREGGWEDNERNRMLLMFTFLRVEIQYLALHHRYEDGSYYD